MKNIFIKNKAYEERLLKEAKSPDRSVAVSAIRELIGYHQRLIIYWAKKFNHLIDIMDEQDLTQEVTITMIDCAKKYKDGSDASFSTYFSSAVGNNFQTLLLKNKQIIKRPERQARFDRERNNAGKRLFIRLNRPPNNEELAKEMGLTIESYRELVKIYDKRFDYLEEQIRSGQDQDQTWADIIPSEIPD